MIQEEFSTDTMYFYLHIFLDFSLKKESPNIGELFTKSKFSVGFLKCIIFK